MNKNLEILIEKLITDENLAKEFVKQDTMDDMYEFCLSIVDGYTAEEFDEFACEMLKLANDSSVQGNLEDELENVSGGKMIPGSKIAAMALAALTTVSGTGMIMASAAGVSKPRTPASQSRSASKSKGTWQKVKNFCSKNKKWLIGGGIAAGVLAGAGITAGVLIHKHNKAKNVVPNQNKAPQNVKGAATGSTGKDTSTNKASSNPTNTAPGSVKPAAVGGDASVKKNPISPHDKAPPEILKNSGNKGTPQVNNSNGKRGTFAPGTNFKSSGKPLGTSKKNSPPPVLNKQPSINQSSDSISTTKKNLPAPNHKVIASDNKQKVGAQNKSIAPSNPKAPPEILKNSGNKGTPQVNNSNGKRVTFAPGTNFKSSGKPLGTSKKNVAPVESNSKKQQAPAAKGSELSKSPMDQKSQSQAKPIVQAPATKGSESAKPTPQTKLLNPDSVLYNPILSQIPSIEYKNEGYVDPYSGSHYNTEAQNSKEDSLHYDNIQDLNSKIDEQELIMKGTKRNSPEYKDAKHRLGLYKDELKAQSKEKESNPILKGLEKAGIWVKNLGKPKTKEHNREEYSRLPDEQSPKAHNKGGKRSKMFQRNNNSGQDKDEGTLDEGLLDK